MTKLKRRLAYVCPKCDDNLQARMGAFFTVDTGPVPGLVCLGCNGLWEHPQKPFVRVVHELRMRTAHE